MIDPRAELDKSQSAELRDFAVRFVAALPHVFGEDLDRTTLWDKIGSALETGYAKTASDDCDFFVSRVLESIQASPSKVARNEQIDFVLSWIGKVTAEMRAAWLSYIATHRYAVLVRARAEWEQYKEDKKAVPHE